MNSGQYWAACQTFAGREHLVRAEIEKTYRGAFVPTFAKVWVTDGKISARECALMPGYVMFRTSAHGWGEVSQIEGVAGVLTAGDVAKRVSDEEMARMVLGHATGAHNSVGARLFGGKPKERSHRRRHRPSKRIRVRNRKNTDT